MADADCKQRVQPTKAEYLATITNYTDLAGDDIIGIKIKKLSKAGNFYWHQDFASTLIKRDDVKVGNHRPFFWEEFRFSAGHIARSGYAKSLFKLEFDIDGDHKKRIVFDCQGSH